MSIAVGRSSVPKTRVNVSLRSGLSRNRLIVLNMKLIMNSDLLLFCMIRVIVSKCTASKPNGSINAKVGAKFRSPFSITVPIALLKSSLNEINVQIWTTIQSFKIDAPIGVS